MEARLIRRPVVELLTGRSQCLFVLNAPTCRNQSSYRRSRHHLNVKPEPSFLRNRDSPNQDHIIFNPPSSMPSVLHTPVKFLPEEDKRKALLMATAARLSSNTRLPPALHVKRSVPHHHLKESDVLEMQRLKREEPDLWDNRKLSKKFNCSSYFVSVCLSQCGGDDTQRKKDMAAKFEAAKARWGPRKRKAKEDQEKRFQLAYRGE